jgi:integrase
LTEKYALTVGCQESMLFGMKTTFKAKPYSNSGTHPWVVDLRAIRKGRKFFKFRAEAEAEARRQNILQRRHGEQAVGLSNRELSEIIGLRHDLAEYRNPAGKPYTLTEAVQFLTQYLERERRCKVTVAEISRELQQAKKRDGMSAAYRRDLRIRLARFCADFGGRLVATVTTLEIDDWLGNLSLGPQSRINFRSVIGVLFSYAMKRGMIDANPVSRISKPKRPSNPPEIFKVDELRALLDAAQSTAPDMLPALCIGAFAGLRDAEINRLDWSEVDLVRGHIEVTAIKAKTAQRRIVHIMPNLAAWLRPYSGLTGNVAPENTRKKLLAIRKTAKLADWPQNGLRHSFASYLLAQIKDAGKVAHELGHSDSRMLFNTYRELVFPQEAERYWKIAPAVESGNVVAFSASA